MIFPLSFADINLWIAIITIILFITTEIIFLQDKTKIQINEQKLRKTTLIMAILFFVTLIIRIYGIATSIT